MLDLHVLSQIPKAIQTLIESGSKRIDYTWGSAYLAGEIVRVDIKRDSFIPHGD